ncbi:DUF268 domain-containing protein [Brasilonema sp. CT11]|nr:DUF268 domain-containing protein [Brasilonema sp. CT11]
MKDKNMAIMGSQRPIYESICLVYEAKSCTTIDFQPITVEYDEPRIKTMTIAQYDQNPVRFDVAISISSFEHDGLGRYVLVIYIGAMIHF